MQVTIAEGHIVASYTEHTEVHTVVHTVMKLLPN